MAAGGLSWQSWSFGLGELRVRSEAHADTFAPDLSKCARRHDRHPFLRVDTPKASVKSSSIAEPIPLLAALELSIRLPMSALAPKMLTRITGDVEFNVTPANLR